MAEKCSENKDKNEGDKNLVCVICLDDIDKELKTSGLELYKHIGCGHPFHKDCISEWHLSQSKHKSTNVVNIEGLNWALSVDKNAVKIDCPVCRQPKSILTEEEKKNVSNTVNEPARWICPSCNVSNNITAILCANCDVDNVYQESDISIHRIPRNLHNFAVFLDELLDSKSHPSIFSFSRISRDMIRERKESVIWVCECGCVCSTIRCSLCTRYYPNIDTHRWTCSVCETSNNVFIDYCSFCGSDKDE